MNPLDREQYRQRYVERLRQLGRCPETLGWRAGTQAIRFRALTEALNVGGFRSVLDVGCGFGDLRPYLRTVGFRGRYVGIDLIPELIDVAREASVDPDAEFIATTLEDFATSDRFDLVLASGIFNARLSHGDNWEHCAQTLRTMFGLCDVVTAADFLSSYVDFRRDDLAYTAPEDALRLAKTLTRRVALRHDYMPYEFATFLFKRQEPVELRFFADYAPPTA